MDERAKESRGASHCSLQPHFKHILQMLEPKELQARKWALVWANTPQTGTLTEQFFMAMKQQGMKMNMPISEPITYALISSVRFICKPSQRNC